MYYKAIKKEQKVLDLNIFNDYEIYYTINNPMPEWNAKTGLKLTLPFYKNSILLEFYQYSYKNFDYLDFNTKGRKLSTFYDEKIANKIRILFAAF